MSASPSIDRLTPGTKINDLLASYPFLVDVLAGLHPQFKVLKNPLMRSTVGKAATLQMAATMGSIPLAELMKTIVNAIRERNGKELALDISTKSDDKADKMEKLKGIILSLHAGENPDEVKARFTELLGEVSPTEIAQMEQQLIQDGLPAAEIQRLCDLHVKMFDDSLKTPPPTESPPGHPIHTYREENKVIASLVKVIRRVMGSKQATVDPHYHAKEWGIITELVDKLREIEKHYLRKENQLFPLLEAKGFTGPTQVMWGIHDDIRTLLKKVNSALQRSDAGGLAVSLPDLLTAVSEMIHKEETVLFPTSLELLNDDDWWKIRQGEEEIGYMSVTPGNDWKPFEKTVQPSAALEWEGLFDVETGKLTLDQLNLIFTHLPVELSFIDEYDTVRFFTNQPEKIFPRAPAVIGRQVQNCHPPKSVHLVNRILEDFRNGKREVAEFWINLHDKFVYIRYFAVRDRQGQYRGTMEVVQDVTAIRKLSGERRLLDEEK